MNLKLLVTDLGNLRDQFCLFGMDHMRFKDLSHMCMLGFECIGLSGVKSQVTKMKAVFIPFANLVSKLEEAQYQDVELTQEDLDMVDRVISILIKELQRTARFVTERTIFVAKQRIDEMFKDVHAYMERITFVPTEDDPQRGC